MDQYIILTKNENVSFYPIKDKLEKELNGFFTGDGYVFPQESGTAVKEIASKLGCKVIHLPLGEHKSFEDLRMSYKSDYLKKRHIDKGLEESMFLRKAGIDELTIEKLSAFPNHLKEEGLSLLSELESLKSSIEKNERLAEIRRSSLTGVELKFISELDPQYFEKTPPPKPCLLYIHEDSGIKQPFLHKEITGMLVAEGGRGKTHLLAQLGACVATGIPFLEKIQVEKPGAVCFVVGENNNEDIQRLLFKTHKHLQKLLEDNKANEKSGKHFKLFFEKPLKEFAKNFIPFSVHGRPAHFVDQHGERTPFFYEFLKALKAKEPEEGFQLIIFDPASRFAGSEAEKDNAIATAFIASLEYISDQLKGRPTILLAHHKSKQALKDGESASQADARGASGLTDGVRWQAGLNKVGKDEDKELSSLEITKTNFTQFHERLTLRKNKEGIHTLQTKSKGLFS